MTANKKAGLKACVIFNANGLWAEITHIPYLDNGACTRLTVDLLIISHNTEIFNIRIGTFSERHSEKKEFSGRT